VLLMFSKGVNLFTFQPGVSTCAGLKSESSQRWGMVSKALITFNIQNVPNLIVSWWDLKCQNFKHGFTYHCSLLKLFYKMVNFYNNVTSLKQDFQLTLVILGKFPKTASLAVLLTLLRTIHMWQFQSRVQLQKGRYKILFLVLLPIFNKIEILRNAKYLRIHECIVYNKIKR
jgi:hypothetical protein